MINKNYIHLLKFFASNNLLTGESKLIFKNSPGGTEIVSSRLRAKEAREAKEKQSKRGREALANLVKSTKGYKEAFDKYPARTVSITSSPGRFFIEKFTKTFLNKLVDQASQSVRRSEVFNRYVRILNHDIKFVLKANQQRLANNMPFTMSLEKGGMLRFKTSKNEFLKVDLKEKSDSLLTLNKLRELTERKNKRKQEIVKKTKSGHEALHAAFQKGLKENPTANFDQLVSKGKYLKKKGKGYIFDFRNKKTGKIDLKAEKSVQIQDAFDLKKLKGGNIHISFLVTGESPAGNHFNHEAVYHKGAGTFFIKGTTRRVRVYNNTEISNITYKAGEYKPAGAKVAPKAKPAAKPKTAPKSTPEGIHF